MKNILILVITLLTFSVSAQNFGAEKSLHNPVTGEASYPEKADKIKALIGRYFEYGKFNGSLLIAHNGKVVFKAGLGMANMEWGAANNTDTKFRIASITKQFTALLIMQLVAENKLDLHTPISTYLPNYPKINADKITIHHLLTHTSGTPMMDDFINYSDIERDRYKPQEIMNIFSKGQLKFTPGEKYSYSNEGYVILGVIIEKITGKSYQQAIQNNVFTPLNMLNSGYVDNRSILKNRASGYVNSYLRGDYINTNYIDMSIPYAAGSLYSTVEDLFIWDQSLYTDKLLQKKYRDLLFEKYVGARRGRHYGYGWMIGGMQIGNTQKTVPTVSHSGGMNGFVTLITRIPSSKSSVIILNNTEKSPNIEITNAIIGILLDKPYDQNISIAYSLVEVIRKAGVTKGHEYFNKIKNNDNYYIDIHEMSIAGYELLNADRLKLALSIFKLNVDAFPESFIVYDSYAEALLINGNKNQAIWNYEKSIELNPNNTNASRILAELKNDSS